MKHKIRLLENSSIYTRTLSDHFSGAITVQIENWRETAQPNLLAEDSIYQTKCLPLGEQHQQHGRYRTIL